MKVIAKFPFLFLNVSAVALAKQPGNISSQSVRCERYQD